MMSNSTNPPISPEEVKIFRRNILAWYDHHRRVLPWRALPGEAVNPYKVWLSEIMLQQTTVAAVIPYFLKFTERWPTVFDLAAADNNEIMKNWAGLGYYARARNLHKCAKAVVEEHEGIFPPTVEALRELPGIGDYTSAAIAAIAFGQESTVVDGNVERVMARYHAVTEPLPGAKKQLKELAHIYAAGQKEQTSDYAQALMDLGATICTPKSPVCALCPVNQGCKAYALGIAEKLPAKAVKAQRPQKKGYIYWVTDKNGNVLLHRRPDKGLLGGMTALPTSEWVPVKEQPEHAFQGTAVRDFIVHTFTHFDLTLDLYTHSAPASLKEQEGFYWAKPQEIQAQDFPTVFKKAVKKFQKLKI